jgi:hypothetical protein
MLNVSNKENAIASVFLEGYVYPLQEQIANIKGGFKCPAGRV